MHFWDAIYEKGISDDMVVCRERNQNSYHYNRGNYFIGFAFAEHKRCGRSH